LPACIRSKPCYVGKLQLVRDQVVDVDFASMYSRRFSARRAAGRRTRCPLPVRHELERPRLDFWPAPATPMITDTPAWQHSGLAHRRRCVHSKL
jgi:hypothetical protein